MTVAFWTPLGRCSVGVRKVPSNTSTQALHSLLAATMASLLHNHSHLHYNSSLSIPISNLHWSRNLHPSRQRAKCSGKARVLAFRVNHKGRLAVSSFPCFCRTGTEVENSSLLEESERRPFDINLAVILAGFAFEAYTSPPENLGKREVDAAGCTTVYLSELFVREIYDGQLFIKLKKGIDLPAMDPWGTSDPYVVFQLDGQVAKSKTKWGRCDLEGKEILVKYVSSMPIKVIKRFQTMYTSQHLSQKIISYVEGKEPKENKHPCMDYG